MNAQEDFVEEHIEKLKRCNLLVEKSNGVLQLNTFIQPYLLQKTIEKGLL